MVRLIRRLVFGVAIAVLLAVVLGPILWTVLGAFKTLRDITSPVPLLFFTPTLDNVVQVLETQSVRSGILNSVIVVGSSLAIGVALGVPGAYALARFDVPKKGDIRFFLLSMRFMPPVAIVVPFVIIFLNLGIYDTRGGLILVYSFITVPTIMWLAIPAFERVPPELSEAASLEGCTEAEIFWRIVLPVATPSLVGAILFTFVITWNELLMALVLASRNITLPVVAASFSTLGMEVPWGVINASAILLALPPLLLLGLILRFVNRFLAQFAS